MFQVKASHFLWVNSSSLTTTNRHEAKTTQISDDVSAGEWIPVEMGLVVKPVSEGPMSEMRQSSVKYVIGDILKCVDV